jgi:peptidoglycan/LPS O-acetylase OafA/YrhL
MRSAHEGERFGWPIEHYWPVPIAIFLVAIAAVAWSTTERLSVSDQGHRMVRALGLTTYPLYLIHRTIGAAEMSLLRRFASPEVAFGITVVTMVALGMFIALALEPSLRRRVRKWVDRFEARLPKPARLYAPGAEILEAGAAHPLGRSG